jgi:alpha-2-macroglobulin
MFILALDAPVKEETVARHAWCDAKGIEEKIAVALVTGEERSRILEARKDFVDRYLHALFKDGRIAPVTERDLLRGTDAERLRAAQEGRLPLTVLKCARRLAPESPMRLVWGTGIESLSGVPTAQDQVLEYSVRPAFSANFSCQRVNKDAGCLPFAPLQLSFTAPVARASAQKVVLRSAQGRVYKPTLPEASQGGDWLTELTFAGPLPEQGTFKLELPGDLRDDAGRRLSNQKRFPLTVKTDVAPPLAKFAASFGIIEAKAGAILAVTLRNLEPALSGSVLSTAEAPAVPGSVLRLGSANARAIAGWLGRVRHHQDAEWLEGEEGEAGGRVFAAERSILAGEARVRSIKIPKPNGARAFEVVGIPLKQPGFYVVELASPKLGAALLTGSHPGAKGGEVYHVSTAALVTNLAVHFKQGRENALAWVTALDTGTPVAGAQVSVQDCDGKQYWKGSTDAKGVARIALALPERARLPGCLDSYDRQYMVLARLGADVSFVMSDWDEGIARWRFNLPSNGYEGPYIATTVLDRTLVRAGETVHMKHLYRQHTRTGFRFVNAAALPSEAVIEHQGSEERYRLPLQWDAQNSAQSTWAVPREAKTGTYNVVFEDQLPGRKVRRQAGSFRVEEFRVPLMRALVDPPARAVVNATQVDVGVQVSYLAGGGAANAPVKLRSVVQPRTVSFPGYEEFAFLAGAVQEGPQEQRRYDWYRGEYLASDDAELPAGISGGADTKALKTLSFNLDAAGGGKATLADVPAGDMPRQLVAELEYADPNGEVLTSAARIALWPAAIAIGLKPDSWALSKDQIRFQALVLDLSGKPVAGSKVAITLFERKTYSHRKRLLGGFYAYESGSEVRRVKTVCEGQTDAKGMLLCEFASPVSGEIVVEARAQDEAGNAAVTSSSVWVAGEGEWWFSASNDDRIDVIPERRRYEPGEKAVFQVRMPFRKATALVTTEREGVIDAFVTELSGKGAAVEVPVKPNHAPNVFVSVLAVRGRVGGVQPTALVDLGKPAFKMGVGEINVGWKAYELKVGVKADKQVYRVREKARVSLQVRRAADGKPPPRGTEVVVAAVDEGLLELAPNQSWNLLETMMQRRGSEVDTATASMQVVGKRHYGRKAREAGGGGGRRTSRELFETLLFWKARVKLDAQGRAEVEIPLNDSLTAFRIVAVAHGGSAWFGTGRTAVRSTQELMLFSGLPPLVREQDRYRAMFTLRNASGKPLEAKVEARAMPTVAGRKGAAQQYPALTVTVQPGASQEVSWDAKAPLDVDALSWEVTASATDASGIAVQDALSVAQRVIEAVPVRTFQATLAQVDRRAELAVEIPADAIAGRGGVRVRLAPSLAGDLPGVREYMSRYPYICLEQLASQAVALRDEARWNAVMGSLPAHLDRDGFAKYFPSLAQGSDVLTTYLLSLSSEAGWEVPPAARARMQSALERFVGGQVVRDPEWRAPDLSIRKIAALQALARLGRQVSGNDVASVSVEPNLWPTSAVIDWIDLLKRAPSIEQRDAKLAQAEQILRSRLNFQGTSMGFSTERSDYLWWLMVSGDVNANRALLSVLDLPKWNEDAPRMMRGSLGRQQRGHWNTTVANAWGVLAAEKFAKVFEQTPVAGTSRGMLGKQQQAVEWSGASGGPAWDFAWPQGPARLTLMHDGGGKPWATIQSRAAIPLKQPLFTGYRIARTVSAVDQKEKGKWSRGDVMRVRLDLEAQSDMSWVVVHDPVPAGATVLGSGLGRDSQILTQGERRQGWVWPAFEERRFDSFRAYYAFVPKGKWTLEYSVRLSNPGEFLLPPSRVEALYAPEMFGELPNAKVAVGP